MSDGIDSLADRFVGEGDDDRVVHDGEFLQMREFDSPDGTKTYEYAHESRCDGEIVAVLPFEVEAGEASRFLLRVERCPAWGDGMVPCALTGGVESDRPVADAARELHEESGYRVPPDDLVSLGACYGTKAMDTVYHLYAVDVTNRERGDAPGDGSDLEDGAGVTWTRDVTVSPDPHVHVMWTRLLHRYANRG